MLHKALIIMNKINKCQEHFSFILKLYCCTLIFPLFFKLSGNHIKRLLLISHKNSYLTIRKANCEKIRLHCDLNLYNLNNSEREKL